MSSWRIPGLGDDWSEGSFESFSLVRTLHKRRNTRKGDRFSEKKTKECCKFQVAIYKQRNDFFLVLNKGEIVWFRVREWSYVLRSESESF